jgi:hypothetical protein
MRLSSLSDKYFTQHIFSTYKKTNLHKVAFYEYYTANSLTNLLITLKSILTRTVAIYSRLQSVLLFRVASHFALNANKKCE